MSDQDNQTDGTDNPLGPQTDDQELRSELIDRLYGSAVDPAALPELINVWDRALEPHWSDTSARAQGFLERAGLLRHVRQVETLLAKTLGTSVMRAEDLALMPFRRTVAFTLDRKLRVSAASRGAREKLGVMRGGSLGSIDLRGEDIQDLSDVVGGLFRNPSAIAPRMIRVRHTTTDKPILISLQLRTPDEQDSFVLAATTELHLSADRLSRLRDPLGLSSSEVEILCLLAQDHTPAEIAELRGRSLNTIRTQIKSLMAKAECNSQADLVRLALTAMALPDEEAETGYRDMTPTHVARGGLELPEMPFQRLPRPGGRCMDYFEFGDPKGRPVLYLCSNFGLCRWPADAEFAARQTGLRVIVPIRAGYGWSDPLPRKSDRLAEVTKDSFALLDHLGVGAAHLLVLDEDMVFATALFHHAPKRILGVLGCAAALPFTRPEQYSRMGQWHRFALGTARFAPQMLSFVARAGFAMARQMGKAGFVRLVYAGSPSDLATTHKPRIFEAIDCGSDIVLAEGVDASDAYVADVSLFHSGGWEDDFRAMSRAVPVIDLVGSEDQSMSDETLDEFRVDYPDVQIEIVESTGFFLLFQEFILVLQRLENLMSRRSE